jgi:hypothetical protein
VAALLSAVIFAYDYPAGPDLCRAIHGGLRFVETCNSANTVPHYGKDGALTGADDTIARRLVVTDNAVHKHIGNVFLKLGLSADDTGHRRVPAVLACLRRGGAEPHPPASQPWT